MQTLPCPACGQSSPSEARFCDSCGARFIKIGRNTDNDVVLDYPMVSAYHARVVRSDRGTFLEDLGSTNGTSLGTPGHRIRTSPLSPTDTVYFGSLPVPATRLLGGNLSLGSAVSRTVQFQGDALVLGRDPAADMVLDYPMVSWQHARLSRKGGQVLVEDLRSTNGTYVNGRRISGPVAVTPQDVISLGSYSFQLTARNQIEQRDYRGNMTVEARGLAIDVPGRRLLEDVSLTIYPSELVGLMGSSGAGKTTLMSALNGYLRPAAGTVLFNGEDLYASYDRFRGHIGYVPQDDIMHSDLTVREALAYTARLRLPTDTRPEEIAARVERVLDQLALTDAADVLIGSAERKGISGGQRKRVNLAMELLTDPFVLFLDEPTSGLSSEDALMVMQLLRKLANEGKTILLTIHQPSREVFELMDSLVLVARDAKSPQPARLVYFGPAYPDAVRFFAPEAAQGDPSPDLMLRGLKKHPVAEWSARYARSPQKRQYVDERAGTNPAQPLAAGTLKSAGRGGLTQWWTLLRRNVTVKARDGWNTAILLAQAPLIGLLVSAVFGSRADGSAATAGVDAPIETSLFLLVLAAIWFGCSNSAREIVGEWAIYRRERMINLGIPSYLAAKLTLLGGLCALQCGVLLLIVWGALDLQGHFGRMFGLLFLSALIGVALGLLVSAAARTSETAIAMIPLLLLPMVILGGMMRPRHWMVEPAHCIAQAMPSRWGFEGLLVVENEAAPQPVAAAAAPPPPPQPAPGPAEARTASTPETVAEPSSLDRASPYFPKEDRSSFAEVAAVCGGLLLLLTVLTGLQLRIRDIHGPFSRRRLP